MKLLCFVYVEVWLEVVDYYGFDMLEGLLIW